MKQTGPSGSSPWANQDDDIAWSSTFWEQPVTRCQKALVFQIYPCILLSSSSTLDSTLTAPQSPTRLNAAPKSSHLDGLEVLQHLFLLEVGAPEEHVQVARLVQPVFDLPSLEVLDSL